ncbi:MAG: amidohydrolase [Acidobacteria bacterium]|nr:amidohydrolase [Acidobacteriota bacterium]
MIHARRIAALAILLALSAGVSLAQAPRKSPTKSRAPRSEPATLALVNGRIWTGNAAQPWAQAVAVRGENIVAVGTNAQIAAQSGPLTKRVDLKGGFAMPGFNDAHLHFLGGALRLAQLDLNGANSLAEMQARLKKFAEDDPAAPWLLGYGWQYSWIPGRLPAREDIDKVVGNRPVYLVAYDGHTGWANTKALQVAGVNQDTAFSGFGEIVRDASGQPTGVLKEAAQNLVRSKIPPPTREQRLDALRRALGIAASLGITSIQNAHGSREDVELYKELLERGQLTARVSVAIDATPQTTEPDIEKIAAMAKEFSGPRLRVGAIKMVMDGVIETHTAAMLEPYSDQPETSGRPQYTQEQANNIVAWADRAGLQVYIHAIGDRGVRMSLDAYENAEKVNGRKDSRFRVEHIETVAAADVPRFKQLDVLASMMPIHADPGTIDVWSRAAGPERTTRAFAWQALERAGARLVFSSDWPSCISLNPVHGLHTAVNRTTAGGQPAGGWIPEHKVSLETALAAYTRGGAYAEFAEKTLGAIKPGKSADIIVLSADPFKIKLGELHALRVLKTVFNGNVLYEVSP